VLILNVLKKIFNWNNKKVLIPCFIVILLILGLGSYFISTKYYSGNQDITKKNNLVTPKLNTNNAINNSTSNNVDTNTTNNATDDTNTTNATSSQNNGVQPQPNNTATINTSKASDNQNKTQTSSTNSQQQTRPTTQQPKKNFVSGEIQAENLKKEQEQKNKQIEDAKKQWIQDQVDEANKREQEQKAKQEAQQREQQAQQEQEQQRQQAEKDKQALLLNLHNKEIQAQQYLQNAQSQRSVRVYENGKWQWEADQQQVQSAQNRLNQIQSEINALK
jgi:hypothetical protein